MLPDGWETPGTMPLMAPAMPMMARPTAMASGPSGGAPLASMRAASFDAGIVSEATGFASRVLRSVSGSSGGAPSPRRGGGASMPPVVLRLAVADLLAGVDRPAPVGRWSVVRVSGKATGETAGAWLVIWTTDRTQPLFRARLADLLAAGERPASLALVAGTVVHLAIEGGSVVGGYMVLELAG